MRTAGMTWMRVPLFVWAIVTYAWLLVIILPDAVGGLTLMLLDRQAGRTSSIPRTAAARSSTSTSSGSSGTPRST